MTRRLTPEEHELWHRIAATVKPRRARRVTPSETTHAPAAAPRTVDKPKRPSTTLKPHGSREPAVRHVKAVSPFPVPALDGKRAARFRKGALEIEGRIDLHGLTLDLAHRALIGFLGQARDRGQRVVLVITGKGGPEVGALKRLVPMWLATPPLAAVIAAAAPAQPQHGGGGALYVYLRRKRP